MQLAVSLLVLAFGLALLFKGIKGLSWAQVYSNILGQKGASQ